MTREYAEKPAMISLGRCSSASASTARSRSRPCGVESVLHRVEDLSGEIDLGPVRQVSAVVELMPSSVSPG